MFFCKDKDVHAFKVQDNQKYEMKKIAALQIRVNQQLSTFTQTQHSFLGSLILNQFNLPFLLKKTFEFHFFLFDDEIAMAQ
jgi:hypothetical protein